jgi:hypothetical protein
MEDRTARDNGFQFSLLSSSYEGWAWCKKKKEYGTLWETAHSAIISPGYFVASGR